MLICDSILEDYKAQEIAHDNKMDEQELKELFVLLDEAGVKYELCDTPVQGKRYNDYLKTALRMAELLEG